MKSMTCRQLGGACDLEFYGEEFDEIVEQSKAHIFQMFVKGDEAHLAAMDILRELRKKEGAMKALFYEKKAEFEAL